MRLYTAHRHKAANTPLYDMERHTYVYTTVFDDERQENTAIYMQRQLCRYKCSGIRAIYYICMKRQL